MYATNITQTMCDDVGRTANTNADRKRKRERDRSEKQTPPMAERRRRRPSEEAKVGAMLGLR